MDIIQVNKQIIKITEKGTEYHEGDKWGDVKKDN